MSASTRVLCIEPIADSPNSFHDRLEKRGYFVSTISGDQINAEQIEEEAIQIVVVNALTVDHRGNEICRALRLHGVDLPILLLLPESIQKSPKTQADIVLIKPFTIRKVVNRIKKLTSEPRAHILHVGDIQLNCRTRLVRRGDNPPQKLTPKQARLLEVLMSHPGEILPRSLIMKQVWQTDYMGDTRTLDVHIRWVREKIEPDPAKPIYITTKRRIGYRFVITEAATVD